MMGKCLILLVCMGSPDWISAQGIPGFNIDSTPPYFSGCFQENLTQNQVYHQRLSEMYGVGCPWCNTCGGDLGLWVNQPCTWAAGQATMTVGVIKYQCQWVQRQLHWHDSSDEWSYVTQGTMQVYLSDPEGIAWEGTKISNVNTGGTWFFPRGWPHGILCISETPCNYILWFNGPQSVGINDHPLAPTYFQAPARIAAYSMGVSEETFKKATPGLEKVGFEFMNNIDPNLFYWLPEDEDGPASKRYTINSTAIEDRLNSESGVTGAKLYNVKGSDFPFMGLFTTGFSQQRVVLKPGGFRPLVWITNADGIMVVTKGTVNVQVQGGYGGGDLTGIPATEQNALPFQTKYRADNLTFGDSFFFPRARAYWIEEATGVEEAEVVTVFNTQKWIGFEARDGFSCNNAKCNPREFANGMPVYAMNSAMGGHINCSCSNPLQLNQRRQRKLGLRKHTARSQAESLEGDGTSHLQMPEMEEEL